jgi:hypothetical protein
MSQISQTELTSNFVTHLPDHNQLPDEDGNFVKNYQEPPQGDLLTDCITPIMNYPTLIDFME